MNGRSDGASSARRAKALEEAAGWCARLELESADLSAFEGWRASSVDNQIAFARVISASGPERFVSCGQATSESLSRRRVVSGGLIAGTACVLGLASRRAYAWTKASSGVGQCRRIPLPDGSSAILNTSSRLEWRIHPELRELGLVRGEAVLAIMPGAACILRGPDAQIALAPGLFNARLEGGALDLLVIKGRALALARDHAAKPIATVFERESLLLTRGAPSLRLASDAELATALAWPRGEILFQHETLGTAVEQYNRYLNRKLILADASLSDIPIGGRFTSAKPQAFLHALELSLGLHVTATDTSYIITK